MRHLLVSIAASVSVGAMAEPTRVGLHLVSIHERAGFRTVTPGLYAEAADGLTLGALGNSEGRLSLYAARTWHTGDDRWSLTAGVITGYRSAKVTPLLVPSLRVPITSATAARLSLIPKPPREGGSSALHLSVETTF